MQLSIENVSKRYRDGNWALRNFTLPLEPGVLGLLGPNGAGKTTLMSILATITRATEGLEREMVRVNDVFKAGENVRVSGVYAAVHRDYHVKPHKVLCLKDEVFPSCPTCGIAAEFQLIECFPHVTEDDSFQP